MLVMIVKFDLRDTPEAVDRTNPMASLEKYRRQVPGLLLKLWMNSRDPATTGAVYVWESEAAMRDFLDSGGLDVSTERYGRVPSVETYTVSAVADGLAFASLLAAQPEVTA